MRKLGFVLLALVCMSFAVPALAVEKGEMTFGLEGGLAVPMGDFGDVAKMGFGGGVFGDYWFTPALAIGVDGSYNTWGVKDDYVNSLEAALSELDPNVSVDADFSVIQFGAHAKYLFPLQNAPVAPWVSAGLGYYSLKSKIDVTGSLSALSSDESDGNMGINAAAGFDFKATPAFSLGLKGAFHHIFTEDKATQYVTVGITLGFTTAAQVAK